MWPEGTERGAILDCAFGRWDAGIGDPTLTGWAAVVLYAVAAVLAVAVMVWAPSPARTFGRERVFWLVLALVLAFLAVNKQLDLQSLLTAVGRCAARAQGWYGARREVQVGLILGLVAGTLVVLALLLVALRGTWRRTALPLLGLAFVLGFVLVRAVGFHQVDRLLGVPVLGLRANAVLELTGPLLICLSATGLLMLSRRR